MKVDNHGYKYGLSCIFDKKPRFIDERGYFSEVYNYADYCDKGIHDILFRIIIRYQRVNTIRGLHFQAPPRAQAKLVDVLGKYLDVIVDIRLGSPSYGRWRGFHLTEENGEELYARGICTWLSLWNKAVRLFTNAPTIMHLKRKVYALE